MEPATEELIPVLARLYDRFAQALDPFSEKRDQAERHFNQQVASFYDDLPPLNKPSFQEFRRGVIVRCLRHLRATDRPASVRAVPRSARSAPQLGGGNELHGQRAAATEPRGIGMIVTRQRPPFSQSTAKTCLPSPLPSSQ